MPTYTYSLDDDLVYQHRSSAIDKFAGERSSQDLWACGLDYGNVDEDRLARVLDILPAKQADLIELTRQGVSQSSMAAFLGCTQPAISALLRRAVQAIRMLLSLPEISEDAITRDLRPHLPPETTELLRVFFRTGSYRRTAQRLGVRGSVNGVSTIVRLRVDKALRLLHGIPGTEDYITFFSAMLAGPVPWAHTDSGRLSTGELRELAEAKAAKLVESARLKGVDVQP